MRENLKTTSLSLLAFVIAAGCGNKSSQKPPQGVNESEKATLLENAVPTPANPAPLVVEEKPENKLLDEKAQSNENCISPTEGAIQCIPKECQLGVFKVESDRTLNAEQCQVYSFESIKIQESKKLIVGPGVELVGVGEAPIINVDAGIFQVLGMPEQKVRIRSVGGVINLTSFGGIAAIDLKNTELQKSLFSIENSSVSFENVDLNNEGVQSPHAAFLCFNCIPESIKGFSIRNHPAVPVFIHQEALMRLRLGDISIHPKKSAFIQIYNGRLPARWLKLNPSYKRPEVQLPNLGYPYHAFSNLLFAGQKARIDPGVQVFMCKGCGVGGSADETYIGEQGKAPVIFEPLVKEQGWAGLTFSSSAKKVRLENTLIIGTVARSNSTSELNCTDAAIDIHDGPRVVMHSTTVLPSSGAGLKLGKNSVLLIEDELTKIDGQPTLSRSGVLTIESEVSINKLKKSASFKEEVCSK
jgi:hypothetical protein